MEISLNELINRQNLRMAELFETQQAGDKTPLLAANIKTTEDRIFELNARLERRREELQQERNCAINDIQHLGRAWVLPHPERTSAKLRYMVRDEEIEKIAIQAVKDYEEARGWQVVSVEKENRGFDLISRRPHPDLPAGQAGDPQTAIEIRFIEVKGRAAIGEIALTSNEYKTAERLRKDYWLYAVFNCGTSPVIHAVQDPVRLGWEPLVKIEHYHVKAEKIIGYNL
jgi:hypothetical protein